jgi:membrane protease YdiL (CAAX protease family)
VALELGTLAVLTSVYLVVVSDQPVWIDAGLGLVAVVLVAATARKTREQIWPPLPTPRCKRLRHCSRHMLVGTLGVALLFAITGRWVGRAAPVFTATMLAALVPFALWATLQQVLFQFYLLGRLRILIAAAPPLALAAVNGLLFGAVHLPDLELTVLTSVGGAVWSWYYLHDRCLGPIAISHAVLGTTYYYWIRGDDLVLRWFS